MSKQSDFIDKISDFTKALESLVDLLKEQNKTGPTEIVNKLLENLDGKAISSIAENLETVKQNTIQINKNVEKTLEAVKSIKKQKETGMFGDVEDKKNKNKVVEGVKTVILIAAGVLAIGLAFKMVGTVDFFSVVALGLGIMFVAMAFAKVASIRDEQGKQLDMKQAGITSAIMVIMAGGLLVSGLILSMMPTLTFFQVLSAIGVGLAIGVTTLLLMKAFDKVDIKQLSTVAPLLPLVLPLVSLGIVLSGYILKMMPELSGKQLLSAIGVGLAMIPSAIAFSIIAKNIKDITYEDAGKVSLIMPLIAVSIVVSSWILLLTADIPLMKVVKAGVGLGIASLVMIPSILFLQKSGLLKPESYKELLIASAVFPLISISLVVSSAILLATQDIPLMNVLKTGIGIGIASLAMVPTIYLLQKAGLLKPSSLDELGIAVGVIVLISTAIMLSSHILSSGNYSNYPSWQWSLGVGLSIIAFTPAFIILSIVSDKFNIGVAEYVEAGIAMLIIAGVIMLTSYILGAGSYGNYPTWEWALGSGLAMLTFGISMIVVGTVMLLTGGAIGFEILVLGAAAMLIIAATVVATSYILGAGSYGNYPTWEWSLGSGLAMIAFGTSMMALGAIILLSGGLGFAAMALGAIAVLLVASTIVATSYILGTGNYSTYPTLAWSLGVGSSMIGFGMPMMFLGLALPLLWLGGIAVNLIVDTIVESANKISKGDYTSYPSSDWVNGVSSSIRLFSESISGLDVSLSDLLSLWVITDAMYDFSSKMNDIETAFGSIFENGGTADKISKSIQTLMTAMPKQNEVDPLWNLVDALTELCNVPWTDLFKIDILSGIIGRLSEEFNTLNDGKIDSFTKIGAGLHLLAVVDQEKLNETLKVLEDKSQVLSEIFDGSSFINKVFDNAANLLGGLKNEEPKNSTKVDKVESPMSIQASSNDEFKTKLLEHVKKIDENIEKFTNKEIEKSLEGTGKDYDG